MLIGIQSVNATGARHMAKTAPKSAVNYVQVATSVGSAWRVPPQPGDDIISFGTME